MLICHKLNGKLLSFLTALLTIACHSNLSIDNHKIFGFGHIALYITSQWVLKFNYPATAETYHVMVLSRGLNLVVMVGLIKMEYFYQALLLKCL